MNLPDWAKILPSNQWQEATKGYLNFQRVYPPAEDQATKHKVTAGASALDILTKWIFPSELIDTAAQSLGSDIRDPHGHLVRVSRVEWYKNLALQLLRIADKSEVSNMSVRAQNDAHLKGLQDEFGPSQYGPWKARICHGALLFTSEFLKGAWTEHMGSIINLLGCIVSMDEKLWETTARLPDSTIKGGKKLGSRDCEGACLPFENLTLKSSGL